MSPTGVSNSAAASPDPWGHHLFSTGTLCDHLANSTSVSTCQLHQDKISQGSHPHFSFTTLWHFSDNNFLFSLSSSCSTSEMDPSKMQKFEFSGFPCRILQKIRKWMASYTNTKSWNPTLNIILCIPSNQTVRKRFLLRKTGHQWEKQRAGNNPGSVQEISPFPVHHHSLHTKFNEQKVLHCCRMTQL